MWDRFFWARMILLDGFRGVGSVFGPPNFRPFGFGVDYRLAFGVGDLAPRPDPQIATLACLPR